MKSTVKPPRDLPEMVRPRAGDESPSIAVITPTYREAENIPLLVERLREVREGAGLDLELVLMDDDSRDGTEQIVGSMHLPWVRLVVRTGTRGLSQAVLEGMRSSTGDVLVVMDADLSHPPEKIPEMLEAVEKGGDFVVGSRFVKGAPRTTSGASSGG